MTLLEATRQLLGGVEPHNLQVARTEGAYLVDARGKRYLDFLSGWCVGNFGWGAEHLREAIRDYRGPDYVQPNLLYAPWTELARMLVRLAPAPLKVAYRATGGTEAVEIALQLAMAATGRSRFVAIEGDYHGNSIGTVSIADKYARAPYKNLLHGCESLAPPLDRKAADRLERMLKRRDVAAFIMEPIVLNIGVEIPEPAFMLRLGDLCRHYGTLLVMDEVACGFGRTGRLFASEHYDIQPDLLCLGKAITGGYAPMGATLATREVARKVGDQASFYSTFGWHPLSTAVALANLRWLVANRRALLKSANGISAYFSQRLAKMPFERVRIAGLAIAAQASSARAASRIAEECRQEGLLLAAEDNVLTLFPPLTLDRRAAKRGLDILEAAL